MPVSTILCNSDDTKRMVKITMALLQWRYYILVHCATPVKFVRRKLATSSQNILTGNQILTFLLEVLPTERFSHGYVKFHYNEVDNV